MEFAPSMYIVSLISIPVNVQFAMLKWVRRVETVVLICGFWLFSPWWLPGLYAAERGSPLQHMVSSFKPSSIHKLVQYIPLSANSEHFTFKGERLEYDVIWLGMVTGKLTIITEPNITLAGLPVIRYFSIAQTNDFFSRFFPVNDEVETFVRRSDFLPKQYTEKINEGSIHRVRSIRFNWKERKATLRGKLFPLPQQCFDPFSGIMALRLLRWTPGQQFKLQVFSQGRVYDLLVKCWFPRDFTAHWGSCFAVPLRISLLQSQSEKKKETLTIWLSADENRIPLRIEIPISVGSLKAELKNYPLRAQKNE